jgi:hypothetical protein
MRRGRKNNCWWRTMDYSTRTGGKMKGVRIGIEDTNGKINNTKKERKGTTTIKSSVCSAEVLDLLICCTILVLVLGILGSVAKGASPLVGQLGWGKMAGWVFFCFPWSYAPSIISGKSEVVSPHG